MKSFKLTPLIIFLILLIVLAISIYLRNSYLVEGVENMFNDKGQFSDFILPEYSQTSPLTQLTETIFYDKKNGNIVEAVVEWNTQTPNGTEGQEQSEGEPSNNGADEDAEMVGKIGENISNTIKTIANESSNSSEEEIKEKVRTKIDETIPLLGNLSNGLNNDITENKDTIVNEIASKIKKEGPNLPENVVDSIPSVKNALNNANGVVDVVGENLSEGHENMDSQISTLKRLIITPRNGADSYIYDITKTAECIKKPTQESLIDNVDTTYGSWSYVSQSEFAPETTVFYMPWKNETYLTVFENADGKMVPKGVFYFSKEKSSVVDVKPVELTNYINTQDDNNNKYVKAEKYGEHDLYQVDKFVLYDLATSNLIVRKEHNTGSINIYNGIGDTISIDKVNETYETNKTHENQEKFAELKAWTTLDGQGENIVVYIKNNDKTLVAVCGFESGTMDSLVLKNVKRFTLYGMDNGDKIEKPTQSECDKKNAENQDKDGAAKVSEAKSEDYILKTQIVPPVCPSCPMCPKNDACTNCGGNGGCGTKGADGKSMVKDEKQVTKVVDENGNVISETVGEVTDLARDTASGAVGLAKDTVGGTVGLGREILGGALGLGRELVGGATGLVQDVTGGATGLIRDAGSGAVKVLTPEQQQQQQQQASGNMAYQQTGGNQGQNYGTNNNFTRFGALPERPSKFIPRTANFSSFD